MSTTLPAAGAGMARAGATPLPRVGGSALGAAGRAAVALLALGLLLMVALVVGPRLTGGHVYVVYSGSMEPAIPLGAVVVVQPTSLDRLAAGDVITFSRPSQPDLPITHRVVSVDRVLDAGGWRIVTKGDANPEPDVWTVDGNQVVGRVAYSLPGAGYALVWIAGTTGKLVLLGAIALAFVVNLVAGRRRAPEAGR